MKGTDQGPKQRPEGCNHADWGSTGGFNQIPSFYALPPCGVSEESEHAKLNPLFNRARNPRA